MRDPGFYWVKMICDDEWEIAYFNGLYWKSMFLDFLESEEDFQNRISCYTIYPLKNPEVIL